MERTCEECGRQFNLTSTQNLNVRYCTECRKEIAAIYVAGALPVRLVCHRYRIGDATLRTLAEEEFGFTRRDVADKERPTLLKRLQEFNGINRKSINEPSAATA